MRSSSPAVSPGSITQVRAGDALIRLGRRVAVFAVASEAAKVEAAREFIAEAATVGGCDVVRIDLRQAVALVIEYPQRRQIIGRGYMLGKPPHAKCFDDFVARGIDYGDGVAFGVGNVHSIWKVSHTRSQVSGPVRRIDVVGIENRRHTWKRTNPLCRCFLCEEAHEQGNL